MKAVFITVLILLTPTIVYANNMHIAYNSVTDQVVSRNYGRGKLETTSAPGVLLTDWCLERNIVCLYDMPSEFHNIATEDLLYKPNLLGNRRLVKKSNTLVNQRKQREKRKEIRLRLLNIYPKRDMAQSKGWTGLQNEFQSKIDKLEADLTVIP